MKLVTTQLCFAVAFYIRIEEGGFESGEAAFESPPHVSLFSDEGHCLGE